MATLTIPDETYQRLMEKAASSNLSADDYATAVLDQITQETQADREALQSRLPLEGEAWRRAFEELNQKIQSRADRYPPGHQVDDSRESIYREREDAQL